MKELDSAADFLNALSAATPAAVQDVDLREHTSQIIEREFANWLFLGCDLSPEAAGHIVQSGGVVIPDLAGFEFQVHRKRLYCVDELFAGFDPNDPQGYFKTRDHAIYEQYIATGKSPRDIATSLARRLHCLLYTSPSPRDATLSRMPSSA